MRASVTVKANSASTVALTLALIVVVPAFNALTNPFATVATVGSLDDQTASSEALSGSITALSNLFSLARNDNSAASLVPN